MSTNANGSAHQHGEDYRAAPIVIFALIITLTVCISVALSIAVLRIMTRPVYRAALEDSPQSAPLMREPRLQVDAPTDRAALWRIKEDILRSYAWVDRSAGIVRMPITQAIDLAVERSLPIPQPAAAPKEEP